MPSGLRSRQTLGPGRVRPGPKVLSFGYRSSMNCVITVRVSPLVSITVQIAL